MLNLLAAFDILEHGILLSRFENIFGISGATLKWIASYLTDRSSIVVIDSEHSKPVLLKYGIPQGSVLGPKKYTMNSDKTEVILFTSKHNAIHMENVTVCFCDINITPMNTVRNLGVIFDSALNMEQQLNNICRAGYQQLRNIGHIRRYLTSDATMLLVNGFITSHLDYCNALLSGDCPRPPLTTYNVYRTPGHGL
jgi:transcriptional regulator of nitric oxide reductase